jgi:hypothetical protein
VYELEYPFLLASAQEANFGSTDPEPFDAEGEGAEVGAVPFAIVAFVGMATLDFDPQVESLDAKTFLSLGSIVRLQRYLTAIQLPTY